MITPDVTPVPTPDGFMYVNSSWYCESGIIKGKVLVTGAYVAFDVYVFNSTKTKAKHVGQSVTLAGAKELLKKHAALE